MFAIWRSCQHYATMDSLPDAQAEDAETVLAAAPRLPSYGRARKFLARRRNGSWTAVGFVKGTQLVSTTTAQLAKYERIRRGQNRWSNDNYRPLTAADHPPYTVDLDSGV